MKLTELFKELALLAEGEVIKGNFGKKTLKDTGIEIPKGYDRFEVGHKEGSNVGQVIGIKGTKKTVVSTGDIRLVKHLVSAYNNDGKSDTAIEKISMIDAFGSAGMKAMAKLGIKFAEKPQWSDLEADGQYGDRTVSAFKLKAAEKAIGKLKEYDAKDVFGSAVKKAGCLANVKKMPTEDVCIIKFSDGTRYLVDTTQANSYIRMWLKIG